MRGDAGQLERAWENPWQKTENKHIWPQNCHFLISKLEILIEIYGKIKQLEFCNISFFFFLLFVPKPLARCIYFFFSVIKVLAKNVTFLFFFFKSQCKTSYWRDFILKSGISDFTINYLSALSTGWVVLVCCSLCRSHQFIFLNQTNLETILHTSLNLK